jgi:hypothetical protein
MKSIKCQHYIALGMICLFTEMTASQPMQMQLSEIKVPDLNTPLIKTVNFSQILSPYMDLKVSL